MFVVLSENLAAGHDTPCVLSWLHGHHSCSFKCWPLLNIGISSSFRPLWSSAAEEFVSPGS